MPKSFPFADRARAVNEAGAALRESFAKVRRRNDLDDPATQRWLAAVTAWRGALELAYPPGFWDDLRRARGGDAGRLDGLIDFLEADPIFFRSGYAKGEVVGAIKRHALSGRQARRLRGVLLNLVARRDEREFRKFCRLAPKVATPAFLDELTALAAVPDPAAARRARWMLAAAQGPKAP